jgi:predicted Zn-dependent peptidase
MTTVRTRTWPVVVLLVLFALPAIAQDLASVERPEAPVFSYATVVNAGSAQEVPGITGLAHMFEHMAFKGTNVIGTSDYAAEQAALGRVEETYRAYDLERRRTVGRDEKRVAELEKAWKDAIAAADKFVVANEFSKIADQAGAVGMNAFTASDVTAYFFSLPSNRFELWAYLESERFIHPVYREFYKERDVVMEERRMRYESSPFGRLLLQFISTAFAAHPYGTPGIGWPSDLQSFSATDAEAFYRKYYVPANMVVSVVGDVKASEVLPVMEKYFGRLPKGPAPEPLRTTEPTQNSERIVITRESAQPIYLEGYHRPEATHPDDATYAVIEMLTSSGRTSRLYRSLVRDKKIAVQASGFNGFPGEKYPNLFTFLAVPSQGHTAAEMTDAINVELERLKTEDVTADELASVKTRVKAGLLRQLDSNQGLALQLAMTHTINGDWRELFRQVDRIDRVTAADVRRVANATFTPNNRTIGRIDPVAKPAAAAATAAPKGDAK